MATSAPKGTLVNDGGSDALWFCLKFFGIPLAFVLVLEILDVPAALAAWAGGLF